MRDNLSIIFPAGLSIKFPVILRLKNWSAFSPSVSYIVAFSNTTETAEGKIEQSSVKLSMLSEPETK